MRTPSMTQATYRSVLDGVLPKAEISQLPAEFVIGLARLNVDDQIDVICGPRGASRRIGDQEATNHASDEHDSTLQGPQPPGDQEQGRGIFTLVSLAGSVQPAPFPSPVPNEWRRPTRAIDGRRGRAVLHLGQNGTRGRVPARAPSLQGEAKREGARRRR